MNDATMRSRVEQARIARLATVTPDGRPHIVPCCFAFDGDVIVSAVDAKPKATNALRRLDHIRASPHASLLVDHYDEDWTALWWVRIDGTARVVDAGAERERAIGALTKKYDQYVAAPPPGPVVVLEPTMWRSWPRS